MVGQREGGGMGNRAGTGSVNVRYFARGDHITAKCDTCGAKVEEKLAGRYDQRLVDAAVDRCADWLEAHMETFHPLASEPEAK